MKYLPLLWSNLTRRKARTVFTLLSIVAAFTLFGVLVALRQGFYGGLNVIGQNKLMATPKVWGGGAMPLTYRNKIARVPGVAAVVPMSSFSAYYQDETNPIDVISLVPAEMLAAFPQAKIIAGSAAAWEADRTGVVVGSALAQQYGWKVGDRIPVNSRGTFVKKDGGHTWHVKIDAIWHLSGVFRFNRTMGMHYKYLNESRATGADTVEMYLIRVENPRAAGAISRRIDALFTNAAPQTETQPMLTVMRDTVAQFGNIGAIVVAITAAVFFSMLLVVANTMGQAIRERTGEIATFKALGFGNGGMVSLVLGEALLLTAIGGGVGLGLSYALVVYLKPLLSQVFGTFGFTNAVMFIGIGLIIALGIAAGLLPALEVARLRTAAALRRA